MNKRSVEMAENAKAGTINDVMARYCIGAHSARKIAEAAGATIRIGHLTRYYFPKMDAYMEACAGAAVEGGADSE